MLFYREKTLDSSDRNCPICGNELERSFLLPVLHDIGTLIEYLLVTFLVMLLSFLGIYGLMILLNIDYSAYPSVNWNIVAQSALVVCLNIGLLVAHFLTKYHLTIIYRAAGFTLKKARACHKCGNRFLILQEKTVDAEDDIHVVPSAARED